jgi:nitronate monooxygenase
MPISDQFASRLVVPLIAAPMTGVSGVDLVVAACRAGVIGSFPTHNAGSPALLDRWLTQISAALVTDDIREAAPVAPNLVVHRSNARLIEDVDCLTRHAVELVITSVGPPGPVVAPLHAAGCAVFAAVARERFAGTIVLAGGISDGVALYAARVLGADLGYMGTRFIAAAESLASDDYRAALVAAELDDITLETGAGGLPASLLAGGPEQPPGPPEHPVGFTLQRLLAGGGWSAGHTVSGVRRVSTVDEIVGETCAEYRAARDAPAPDALAGPVATR